MPLSKKKLAEAVAKYIEYKENGFTAEEIRAEIEKDEAAYKPADIDQIIKGIDEIEGEGTSSAPGEQKTIAPTAPAGGLNRDYEEYAVEAIREEVYDEAGKSLGTKVVNYRKVKKIRTTRVTDKVAEELNSQSVSSNLRLYPID
jgi:hypothetical protein